jgi:phosphoribosylanthranilate isomerase
MYAPMRRRLRIWRTLRQRSTLGGHDRSHLSPLEAVTTRVKICCISSVAEAHMAIRYGASALGLVSRMPSGPGVIDEALIAEIAAIVPPPVATFLLTSSQNVDEIVAQQRRCRTNTIQLCDRVEPGGHQALRAALPGVKIVQVVHVTGEESVEEAVAASASVDAVLLDSGNQALAVKELGGTGRVHDWSLSRRIRDAIQVPLFLAGGLKADNVAPAVARVAPFGIDVCSGVRTDGRLDERKLSAVFEAIR